MNDAVKPCRSGAVCTWNAEEILFAPLSSLIAPFGVRAASAESEMEEALRLPVMIVSMAGRHVGASKHGLRAAASGAMWRGEER